MTVIEDLELRSKEWSEIIHALFDRDNEVTELSSSGENSIQYTVGGETRKVFEVFNGKQDFNEKIDRFIELLMSEGNIVERNGYLNVIYPLGEKTLNVKINNNDDSECPSVLIVSEG